MPTVHLIHGFIGAGKTTFAKQLESQTGAFRLTPDEWLVHFYGDNPPADQFRDYEQKVGKMCWIMAGRLVARNVDVIMDFGFWTRATRDRARKRVDKMGATPQFYALDCNLDDMKARTLKRTENLPADAVFVDAAAFDAMLARFEPMGADEPHKVISTRG